jgi:AAA domain
LEPRASGDWNRWPVMEEKLNTALAPPMAVTLTRRDAVLPDLPNKAHAVTGMRRSGKTSFLRQLVAERQSTGSPERAVYISFDDDRLAEIKADQLSALLEAYYRRFPALRRHQTVSWFLDEIQLVPGCVPCNLTRSGPWLRTNGCWRNPRNMQDSRIIGENRRNRPCPVVPSLPPSMGKRGNP